MVNMFGNVAFLNEGEQDIERDKMNARIDADPDPKFNASERHPAHKLAMDHRYDKALYKGADRKRIDASIAKADKARDKEYEAEEYARKKTGEEIKKRNIDIDKDPKSYNDIFDVFYRNKMKSIKRESSIFESVEFI